MARSDGWDNVRKFGKTVRKTATMLKFLSGLRTRLPPVRGPRGARDKFARAAIAQDLRRFGELVRSNAKAGE
jgi:hypothetical protein